MALVEICDINSSCKYYTYFQYNKTLLFGVQSFTPQVEPNTGYVYINFQ